MRIVGGFRLRDVLVVLVEAVLFTALIGILWSLLWIVHVAVLGG